MITWCPSNQTVTYPVVNRILPYPTLREVQSRCPGKLCATLPWVKSNHLPQGPAEEPMRIYPDDPQVPQLLRTIQ